MNTTTVLVTLVAYKLLLVGIGIWASRRTGSEEDFFVGGRSLGPIVAAISYGSSAASAWTLLGMSGLAWAIGLSAIWAAGGAVLGCVIAWTVLARQVQEIAHSEKLVTTMEFLARGADGKRRRQIIVTASVIVLFCFIFYIASQFQGAGNTFASSFDMGASESLLLGGIIIMIYTLLGGFWAVSVTDTLQGLLMLFAAVLIPITAMTHVGGFDGFWSQYQVIADPDALTFTGRNAGLAVAGMIFGGLAIGVGAIGQPHLMARFMALKDERSLRIGRVMAIGWYAVVFFGMCLTGFVGKVIIPDAEVAERIFFDLIPVLFDPVFGAVLLAAVLSAVMSTADSMLLVAASTATHDLGIGGRDKAKTLLMARIAIVVLCGLSIAVAIYLPATIFERVLFAWIAIGSAFGPTVLATVFGWQRKPEAVLMSIIVGFVLAVSLYLLPSTTGDWAERLVPILVGLGIVRFWK